MEIPEHLAAVLEGIDEADRRLDAWVKDPSRKRPGRDMIALGNVLGGRSITPEGAAHFRDAVAALLECQNLQSRISSQSARKCLDTELQREISRAQTRSQISFDTVISRTIAALHDTRTFSGDCFFPALVTHEDQAVDLRFGPVRLISRDIFDIEYAPRIDDSAAAAATAQDGSDWSLKRILGGWRSIAAPYAFMVVVRIKGFEQEMAKPAARQAAEFTLNLLRIIAPHRMGPRIRLAGDSRPETEQAFLTLSNDGQLGGSLREGGEGAILPDDWPTVLLRCLGEAKPMVDALAARLVSGAPITDSVTERIRYADQLFTEAFQDSSPRLALVKMVSALESLAVLPRQRKRQTLEVRCALACGEGDLDYMRNVRRVVGQAYRIRNDVVHGDAPDPLKASRAIDELQAYLLSIVLHLWRVLASIQVQHQPESISVLRQRAAELYDAEKKLYEAEWSNAGIPSLFSDLDEAAPPAQKK